MFDINFIRGIVKKYIDNKISKFVIYPFGINGLNVKNVLESYFDLEPSYIVDNEYSKYSDKIIDINTLKNVYQQDMYLILTVENPDINRNMFFELSQFIPEANVINIYGLYCLKREDRKIIPECVNIKSDGKGFRLPDFLPLFNIPECNINKSKKIKVRIEHSNPNVWNSLFTICQAFKMDSLFDVLIVVSCMEARMERAVKQVQECGYNYIEWDKYQIKKDSPDILILTNAHNGLAARSSGYRDNIKLIIFISLMLIHGADSVEKFWESIENGFGQYCPDYYLFDSLLYKELQQSDCFSKKIIEMGNAKFDGIYRAVQRKEYNGEWEKLQGKTTILWVTGHGIVDRRICWPGVTFDVYAKSIFEYAKEHSEMGFIFRPHSAFVEEMLLSEFWSQQDIRRLKEYCGTTPNIVYDDMESYDMAYSIADAILTDAHCGIVCSALPMLKPICVVYRPEEGHKGRYKYQYYKMLLENYYSACSEKDVVAFFDMIQAGQDPMRELRIQANKECIKNFDGQNGYRIQKFIKDKYFER